MICKSKVCYRAVIEKVFRFTKAVSVHTDRQKNTRDLLLKEPKLSTHICVEARYWGVQISMYSIELFETDTDFRSRCI